MYAFPFVAANIGYRYIVLEDVSILPCATPFLPSYVPRQVLCLASLISMVSLANAVLNSASYLQQSFL